MAYTLQQLSDFEDIRTLKHRYFRAIDTADKPLLETLFTDDVAVDYRGGRYRVTLSGKADMIDFLLNSFHSGLVPIHHGHGPEIELVGEDAAKGTWYLEDVVIGLERKTSGYGSALYYDEYRREGGSWKIARTEYDRLVEVVRPLADERVTAHYLGTASRQPDERGDISQLIHWHEVP